MRKSLLSRIFLGTAAIAVSAVLSSAPAAQAESKIERLQELVENRPLLRAFLIKFYKWRLAKHGDDGQGEGGNGQGGNGDIDKGSEHRPTSPHN